MLAFSLSRFTFTNVYFLTSSLMAQQCAVLIRSFNEIWIQATIVFQENMFGNVSCHRRRCLFSPHCVELPSPITLCLCTGSTHYCAIHANGHRLMAWTILLKRFCTALFCMVLLNYHDVIMGAIASQITSLTIVYSIFIQTQIKENIKAPRHWPLCGEFTGDRWIPRTNGQ